MDGHGYHGDEKTGEELPYTHNIIFQAVSKMITIEDTQEACSDAPLPSMASQQDPIERATDPEYVELSELEQLSLHNTLHKSYEAAPAETGASDEDIHTPDCAVVPEVSCDLLLRAELAGVSPEVWTEVSRW